MSELSYLEKLLDGAEVEWLPLGDISEIYGGLTGKTKSDFDGGNAKYISYKSIFGCIDIKQIPADTVKVGEGERQHRVKYGDVLFTGSSEIAEEAGMSSAITIEFDEPVYLNSFSFGVRFNEGINIIPEFSKYLFRTNLMRAELSKTASGVTRFNISKARFRKVLIPIISPNDPEKSLAIQSEIVQILDKFTALTAELTSELTARKKQYNYYRDQLLSFKEGEVEWKTLEEIGHIVTGRTPKSSDKSAWGDDVDFVTPSDIKNGMRNITCPSRRLSAEGAASMPKVRIPSGSLLVTCIGADMGKTVINANDCIPNQQINAITLTDDSVQVGYLFHVLTAMRETLRRQGELGGGTMPLINKSDFSKIVVPVPSYEEQNRIATTLDKFDALTNSITEGLPREIALRQQQYEYYRDLLFNFPKPADVAN